MLLCGQYLLSVAHASVTVAHMRFSECLTHDWWWWWLAIEITTGMNWMSFRNYHMRDVSAARWHTLRANYKTESTPNRTIETNHAHGIYCMVNGAKGKTLVNDKARWRMKRKGKLISACMAKLGDMKMKMGVCSYDPPCRAVAPKLTQHTASTAFAAVLIVSLI